MPSSNPLPPKENSLFKRILKCYEHKHYKMGLKFARQILSNPKFAEHGETLAMKGLTLNCLGRKEEAYEHVRRGLRNDLKSHVCWHVYGLLQRSDKKYDEAIKCYRNALKWDKDNIQILRDLSLPQIQMRDLEGYRDTRYQLFQLRPAQRASWISFAMSYHLLKDYEMALKILEAFRKTLIPGVFDYEHSELLLYQNMVIRESGDLKGALKHLLECQNEISDKLTVSETIAQLYLDLGKLPEAEEKIKSLLLRNPENMMYYNMLQNALDLKTDYDKAQMLSKYMRVFPEALTPKRLILNHVFDKEFYSEVDHYLKRGLRKGVPALFVNLRSLYADPKKIKAIEELMLSYVSSLKDHGFFSSEADCNENLEPPSALLWAYYYLAQHYDHLGSTELALKYVNTAIEHTPTLIELFVTKGRIYKHAGDVQEAYKWLDEAQSLDTADRYINSKCAKYMLRANLIKDAEETCSKFTREGVSAMENLNEMQCMWFQTECAFAFQRLENWGEALKKCHEVERHFSEIVEDQYDFHTYCLRKMTLRSYIGLLRLEDVLRSHKFYQKAAKCAITVYLYLHDQPIKDKKAGEERNTENLAPSELKKFRSKQRKAQKKAELQQAELVAAAEKRELHNKSRQSANDTELDAPPQDELIPERLAKVPDPLEQAIKFLQPLQLLCSKSLDTHMMAYEIYSRKEKPLLMLQSVKRAFDVGSMDDPMVHSMVIQFTLKFETWKAAKILPEPVITVIKRQMEPMWKGRNLIEINNNFLARRSDHLPSRLHGARMISLLEPARRSEALKFVTQLSDDMKEFTIEACVNIMKSLKAGEFGPCEAEKATFKSKCHEKFRFATAFSESAGETSGLQKLEGGKEGDKSVDNCFYD